VPSEHHSQEHLHLCHRQQPADAEPAGRQGGRQTQRARRWVRHGVRQLHWRALFLAAPAGSSSQHPCPHTACLHACWLAACWRQAADQGCDGGGGRRTWRRRRRESTRPASAPRRPASVPAGTPAGHPPATCTQAWKRRSAPK
jgi:hypothetical protein